MGIEVNQLIVRLQEASVASCNVRSAGDAVVVIVVTVVLFDRRLVASVY